MLKRWQLWLGLIISVLCLYLALRGMELDQVWLALKTATYWWILPGVAVYFFGVWARTRRWHYLLRPMLPVPLARLFPVVCIGYMGNNVYPARAGEVIRAYVLKKKEGVSISAALATIVVERIFDGVVMLLFVFFSLPFVPMQQWLRQVVLFASLLFLGALAVFFVMAISPQRSEVVYNWLIKRLLPERFHEQARGLLDRFVEGLQCLRSGRDVLMIFITSLVIWLAETVTYWFVMQGFDFSVPFYVLMLMNGVVNLFTTIPSSPGYIGTFDAPGIAVLATYGVNSEVATAYTLILHAAALWFPITALGAYYMWRESVSWAEFGLAAEVKGAKEDK